MATITTRVDDDVKASLHAIAKEIGIPVSSLFNAWAKDLIRTKKVSFSLDDETIEDEQMYANAHALQKKAAQSIASGRSSLVI
jgi:addiction module RelB/DinJ family antitoxin